MLNQGKKIDKAGAIIAIASLLQLSMNLITPISNHDIGFDIVTGRLIRETLSIPSLELFSHTFPGSPWFIYQWIPDIIFSIVYDSGGTSGLILFKTALIFFAMLIIFLHASKIFGLIAASIGICLSSLMMQYSSDVRTYIFGYLFMAILILLTNDKYVKLEKHPIRLIILAGIMILWTNVHVTVFLGCLYIAIYGLFYKQGDKWLRKVITVGTTATLGLFCGIILASIISPHGFNLWKHFFNILIDPYFRHVYAELNPFFSLNGYSPLLIIGLTISTILVTIGFKKTGHSALVYAIFFLLTIAMARNSGMFALAMIFPVAGGVSTTTDFFPVRRRKIELIMALCVFILMVFSAKNKPGGLDFARGFYPKKVYSFIREANMPGKGFNDMWYGGSFILEFYPERKVFVDSRTALAYPTDFLKKDYAIIKFAQPGWEEMLLKYKVNWVLLIHGRYERFRQALFQSPHWIPLYKDDVSDIFLKNSIENRIYFENKRLVKNSKTEINREE